MKRSLILLIFLGLLTFTTQVQAKPSTNSRIRPPLTTTTPQLHSIAGTNRNTRVTGRNYNRPSCYPNRYPGNYYRPPGYGYYRPPGYGYGYGYGYYGNNNPYYYNPPGYYVPGYMNEPGYCRPTRPQYCPYSTRRNHRCSPQCYTRSSGVNVNIRL